MSLWKKAVPPAAATRCSSACWTSSVYWSSGEAPHELWLQAETWAPHYDEPMRVIPFARLDCRVLEAAVQEEEEEEDSIPTTF